MNTRSVPFLPVSLLAAALALPAAPTWAQHAGHEGHVMPAAKPAPKKPAPKPAVTKRAATPAAPAARPAKAKAPAAAVDHKAMGHGPATPAGAAKPATRLAPAATAQTAPAPATRPADLDHAAMGHGAPGATPTPDVDHAAMGHGTPATTAPPTEVDHAAMGHGSGATEPVDHAAMNHGAATDSMQGMDHAAMGHGTDPDLPADAPPRTPIPAVTDADRAAAFPPALHGHEVHDRRIHSYWLVDRLEWQDTEEGSLGWEGVAWLGGDIHRLWLRTEGEAADGEVESASAEVLYGRAISPWWDAVAGVRHDFGHGPSRTYAALGVQGLSPYKFEVEATAFVGASGRGGATLEAEYDTLITNRLILQWQGEATLYAKDDAEIGVGSGLSRVEAGARLRYEFSRRFAPYIGVEFERAFGETADLRREHGEPTRDTRLVAGIRFWF